MKAIQLGIVIAGLFLVGVAGAENWTDKIEIGGDFRYRHDYIDRDQRDERSRHQIRLRVNISARVRDQISIIGQIATGYDNPTAANQTLTDGFSSKSVAWTRAYLTAADSRLPGVTLFAGKMPNLWFRPGDYELVWDDDLNPEGVAARYAASRGAFSILLNSAWFWIEERTDEIDSYLTGGQLALSYADANQQFRATGGASYLGYMNIRGFPTFYNRSRSFGNSVDADSGYLTDFEIIELFAEAKIENFPMPLLLAANLAFNTVADSLDTGWLLGLQLGQPIKPGDLAFRYNYREVENNAVVGVFTDNIFAGGGTDVAGHEFNLTVQIAEATSLKVNYFETEIGIESSTGYRRLQFDFRFRF
jgi:hypothetical protein